MPVIYTFNSIATTVIHNRVGTKLEPFDVIVGDWTAVALVGTT
jgi:hypothetical protein